MAEVLHHLRDLDRDQVARSLKSGSCAASDTVFLGYGEEPLGRLDFYVSSLVPPLTRQATVFPWLRRIVQGEARFVCLSLVTLGIWPRHLWPGQGARE